MTLAHARALGFVYWREKLVVVLVPESKGLYCEEKLDVHRYCDWLFSFRFKKYTESQIPKEHKMAGYTQSSFWIPTALVKICFSRIVINRTDINTSVSVLEAKSLKG